MQIGIPCVKNSLPYAELLVHTIKLTAKTAMSGMELLFTVPVGHADEYKTMCKRHDMECKVFEVDNGKLCNRGHANALNILFANMEQDIGAFIDCDVAMLLKHWDAVLRPRIKGDVAIIGSEYWQSNKYQGFPNVIFCLFDVKILRDCGIDFMPGQYYKVEEPAISIYGQPLGYKILLDTGYQLPLKLKSAGYKGQCLRAVRSHEKRAVIKAKKHRKTGEEYYLDKHLICTHFRRGVEINYTHGLAKIWRANINKYLTSERILT